MGRCISKKSTNSRDKVTRRDCRMIKLVFSLSQHHRDRKPGVNPCEGARVHASPAAPMHQINRTISPYSAALTVSPARMAFIAIPQVRDRVKGHIFGNNQKEGNKQLLAVPHGKCLERANNPETTGGR